MQNEIGHYTFDADAADYITRYRWGLKQREDYTERDERGNKKLIFSSDF